VVIAAFEGVVVDVLEGRAVGTFEGTVAGGTVFATWRSAPYGAAGDLSCGAFGYRLLESGVVTVKERAFPNWEAGAVDF
jgi:hypothetical protein